MRTIIGIPFRNFKEKIRITREWSSKANVQIIGSLVYIEQLLDDDLKERSIS